MKKRTNIILVTAAILIVYGYLCRPLCIYFFWDSKALGWILMLIGAVSYLVDDLKIRKDQNKKNILHKIGIGILLLNIFGVIILSVLINFFQIPMKWQ